MTSSSWDVVEATELTEEILDGLFDNEIAAVRIPNFVSAEACRIGSEAVLSNGFDYYETLDPPLGRIGIAQYDHRADKTEYFRLAALAHEKRKQLFAEAGDPIPLVADAVAAGWDGKVRLASEDAYGDYFAGIVRVTVKGTTPPAGRSQTSPASWPGTSTSTSPRPAARRRSTSDRPPRTSSPTRRARSASTGRTRSSRTRAAPSPPARASW